MNAATERTTVAPAAIGTVLAIGIWLALRPHDAASSVYVGLPVCMATFLVVQLVFPVTRWNNQLLIGPGNLAFLLFGTVLVLIPTLILVQGPYHGSLKLLPSTHALNLAAVAQSVAYVGYALGATLSHPRPRRERHYLPGANADASALAALLMALGLLGLFLAFRSPGALLAYFGGHAALTSDATAAAGAAATFLRPFASWGFLVAWCVRLARRPQRPALGWHLVNAGLVLCSVAATATFSYNRAAVVVPLVGLLSATHRHLRRFTPTSSLAIVLVLITAAYLFGGYRSVYTGTQGGRISKQDANLTHKSSLSEQVQLYGNGPQFWGILVDDVARDGRYRLGSTISGSVLLPVPVLGKPFRAHSGPNDYNQLVYGRPGVVDQILPTGGELYWNFGFSGVLAGFMLVGAAVRRCEVRAREAEDLLGTFIYCYVGSWCSLSVINSISVLSQVFVYFLWPVVAILVLRKRREARNVAAPGVVSVTA